MKEQRVGSRTTDQFGISTGRLRKLTAGVQRIVDERRLPGISLMVVRNGSTVYSGQFGWANIDSRIEIEEDTVFRLFSITKLVTAVTLMGLVEEGRVRVSDPVSMYIPEFAEFKVCREETAAGMILEDAEREISIHDLLIHTSGLGYVFNIEETSGIQKLYEKADLLNPGRTLEGMVREITRLPLLFQPGANFHYGHSTDVLGRIIEIVEGNTLDNIIRYRVLDPLEMNDTGFSVPEGDQHRISALYTPGEQGTPVLVDDPAKSIYRETPTLLIPGSGLVSTASDCIVFARMLLNRGTYRGERILGRKSIEYMSRNHLPDDLMPQNGFGQGFCLQVCVKPQDAIPLASVGSFCKGGAGGSIIWVDPAEELCFVQMSQLIAQDLVRRYPALFSEPDALPNSAPASELDPVSLVHTLLYQALE